MAKATLLLPKTIQGAQHWEHNECEGNVYRWQKLPKPHVMKWYRKCWKFFRKGCIAT